MKERGPVFVTAFSPLSMVIVAVLSSIALSEILYLGRFASIHTSALLNTVFELAPLIYKFKGLTRILLLFCFQGNGSNGYCDWPIYGSLG